MNSEKSLGKGVWCLVPNCYNKRPFSDVVFFSLPKEKSRCQTWLNDCGRKDLLDIQLGRSYVICSQHFDDKCFMDPLHRRLMSNAKSTIFPTVPSGTMSSKLMPTSQLIAGVCNTDKNTDISILEESNSAALLNGKENILNLNTAIQESSADSLPKDFEKTYSNKRKRENDNLNIQNKKPQRLSTSPIVKSPVRTKRYLKITSNTPRKRSLRRKFRNKKLLVDRLRKKVDLLHSEVCKLKSKCSTDALLNSAFKLLPGTAGLFFGTHIKLCIEGKRWMHYSPTFKRLCLSLLYCSPKAYNFCRKMFGNKLPHRKTLLRSLEPLSMDTGINNKLLNLLQIKVQQMSTTDKLCGLSFDEMTIKQSLSLCKPKDNIDGYVDLGPDIGRTNRIGSHVLVFMARGICTKWKQALGYVVTANVTGITLKQLVVNCISKLQQCGLIVKFIVCDQGGGNRNVMVRLGISPKQPYFMCNDEKIFAFFDPPHIVKCIRNNLKKYKFMFGEKTAKWSDIEQFYLMDSKLNIRMAPKLTFAHVYLPYQHSKMRVRLATQVFSNSVGAAMSALCAYKILPASASHTAEFILKINNWFDAFNSRTPVGETVKMRSALSDKGPQIKFLMTILEEIDSWKFIAPSNIHITTLYAIKLSTSALIELWNELKIKYELKYLLTSRINQDCVENFFGTVRCKGGFCFNPTVSQFKQAFCQVSSNQLLSSIDCKNGNCEKDLDYILASLSEYAKVMKHDTRVKKRKAVAKQEISNVEKLSFRTDVIDMSSKSIDSALHYVSGYLARKLQNLHLCQKCCFFFETEKNLCCDEQLLIYFKSYSESPHSDFGSLIAPNIEFVNLIKECETIFMKYIEHCIYREKVTKLLKHFFCQNISIACNEFKDTLISFFINVRLFYFLKFKNYTLMKPIKIKEAERKSRILFN